ncbi:rho family-interacting cell polarization regulator 2-like isoform X2 [Corticium candelabrum]|nr:rho family-interacting cell polarization regulator 2-like isoform X2 [Corticium candelabrum]
MLRYKLREGADNLAAALATQSTRQSKTTLLELKAERKEVVEQMCKLEDSLEELMGVFHIRVVGLVGFSRLCSGDVFEAKLQMGQQKWKSKCKVQKLQQQWTDNEVMFACQLNPELTVKVVESRMFQSHAPIGTIQCSSRDLMTVQPQRVMLVLKGTSSLRLSAICCWSPWVDSEVGVLELPERRLVLGHVKGSKLAIPLSLLSDDEGDRPMSGDWSSTGDNCERNETSVASPKRVLLSNCESLLSEKWKSDTLTLAYNALSTEFEKYKGQYTELADFEKLITDIREVLQYERKTIVKQNSMTLSESSALDQFGFLEKAVLECGGGEDHNSRAGAQSPARNTDSPLLFHVVTRVSVDSGKGHSMSSDSSEQSPYTKKRPSSSVFPTIEKKLEILSTGNRQLDMALVHHLYRCSHYVQRFNSFGPLKLKESQAVQKLTRQREIIHQLSLLVTANDGRLTVEEVLPELTDNDELCSLWTKCCGNNALFVGVSELIEALDHQFGASLWANYMAVASNVLPAILRCVLDNDGDDVDSDQSLSIITVYDYYDYFNRVARKGLNEYIMRFAKNMLLVESLLSRNRQEQEKAMDCLYGYGFSEQIIEAACSLLARNDPHITSMTGAYIERVAQYPVHRMKVLNVLLLSLENTDQHIRQGACVALGILKATEAISELAYLAKCDFVTVKETARQALLACGEDGQIAMLQSMPTTFNDLGPVHTLVPQEVL